jgi:hypothetical protein
MSTQVLRIHITIHKDKNGAVIPISKSTLNNRKDGRLIAFFSHFNPANWFSEFKDIKISLEEFACKQE